MSAESMLSFPALVTSIPPPPPQLDVYLDVVAKCFARHGIKRTSVQDVARELGVNRTTVYRQVGNVDDMVRLLLARELHRFIADVSAEGSPVRGPASVVTLLAAVVRYAESHPVLIKVLRDEPDLIGPFLVSDLPALIARVAGEIAPSLERAMDEGKLARRDPQWLADWLVRIAVTLVVAPPGEDLEEFLGDLLLPTLTPSRRGARHPSGRR